MPPPDGPLPEGPPAAIDVLIPVHDAAGTVAEAVGTIQAQTRRDIRIVLVDDGSTDATPSILAGLAAADPRIVVLTRPNGGIVDALNEGLGACRAPLVARFDADDRSDPRRLARQAAFLDANPAVVAVGANVRHIDADGRPTGTVTRFDPPDQAVAVAAPSREPYLCHPFLVVRREAVAAVGGYRHAFHAEDTDLYWRLAEHGRLVNLPDVLGDYRLHAQSVSSLSVLNGRIAALFSQRAGLSAARRRAGRPDLAFPREALDACRAAGTLDAILRVGEAGLEDGERDWLAIMASAKLLTLAAIRPFELDAADCRTIRDRIERHGHLLTASNRRAVDTMAWSTAARLLASGRAREAARLVSPRDYGQVAARLAFRVGTTPRLRRLVRRVARREEVAR